MVPSPGREHQRLERELLFILTEVVERAGLGIVLHDFNVADPVRKLEDFRVPDISVVLSGGGAEVLDAYIAGGPDLVVEVLSPGDETYEKLPWYAAQGVRELLLVHRDTKDLALYRLQNGELVRVAASPDVLESSVVPLRFERIDRDGKLGLRVALIEQPGKVWEI